MSGMSGYTKLFHSILGSSIWRSNMETKILWITLLAMSDKNGVAEASVGGLADFARLSVEQTKKALLELSSPDDDSRTKEHEGRRIAACEGGWIILNHAKYRAKMGADERREYKRLKQREYRKASGQNVDNHSTGGQGGHIAEAEAEAEEQKRTTAPPKPKCPNCGVVGSLQRCPARNGNPAQWWCRTLKSKTFKGDGCGENFPVNHPAILSQLTPFLRKEILSAHPLPARSKTFKEIQAEQSEVV